MAYTKDPTEKKDYSVDWTAHLAAGETVTTSTWTLSGSGLTKSGESDPGAVVTVRLSAGTVGTQYRVTNHVITSTGQEFERSFDLVIADL